MILALFGAAQVVSAALLFLVQPLYAKLLLPQLGGAPAVWTLCATFFQVAVLTGYLYAHLLARVASVRRQAVAHGALLLAACLALPPALHGVEVPSRPIAWLLGQLALGVGAPVVLLAATTPLLAGWFVRSGHRLAGDPTVLYASSNAGSLGGLLAYPLLVEPLLPVGAQAIAWSAGYLLAVALLAACASRARGAPPPRPATDPRPPTRARWIFLGFVPASLTLGFTTWVTTDLAAVPLLWVIPLAIYLLAFVAAFARRPFPRRRELLLRVQPFVLLAVAVQAFAARGVVGWGTFAAHLALLAVSCLVCHRELAESRPGPARVTEYYVCLALGGVAGGLWNSLLAPHLFPASVGEYPLALVLTCLCRPRAPTRHGRPWVNLALPLGALVVLLEAARQAGRTAAALAPRPSLALAAVALAAALPFLLRPGRRVRLAAGVAAILLAASLQSRGDRQSLLVDRTFYGIHRVRRDGPFHVLLHGDTRHGLQSTAAPREPLGYHTRGSPIGRLLATAPARDVGVVGLGAGVLAAYGRPGQRWTFYELDPLVETIARDPTCFTYLRDSPAGVQVVLGDARLSLARTTARHDLLVLDAFSSDAVPVHLLTREAVALYRARLAPAGLLVFNVSNRYVRLAPVLAAVARDLGLAAFAAADLQVTPAEASAGKFPSEWVALAPPGVDLTLPWQRLPVPTAPAWTDQRAPLAAAFSFR